MADVKEFDMVESSESSENGVKKKSRRKKRRTKAENEEEAQGSSESPERKGASSAPLTSESEDGAQGEGEDSFGRLDSNFEFEEKTLGADAQYEVENKEVPKKKDGVTDTSPPQVSNDSLSAINHDNTEGSSDESHEKDSERDGNDIRKSFKTVNLNNDSSKDGKAEECASCKLLQQDLDLANKRLKEAYDKVQKQAAEIQKFNQREKEGDSFLEKMKSTGAICL
ncbi:hypothetical protein KUF71_007912 [Frankliniella fusca]|uniref:Uncharacterized protein n=1 Tax=Frankliniella fusca TaxID=407009 RepID=A0AAE1LGM5_9NEOP|nr:hypothetical protein KUF71_007912 [Frankliniella fusca]